VLAVYIPNRTSVVHALRVVILPRISADDMCRNPSGIVLHRTPGEIRGRQAIILISEHMCTVQMRIVIHSYHRRLWLFISSFSRLVAKS